MKKLWYFGCIDRAGHYLWRTENSGDNETSIATQLKINPHLLKCLDSTFAPGYAQFEFIYNESIVPPFRILSWWDRTVDKRPGSNSSLIGIGYDSAEQMFEDAKINFPKVMKRQGELKKYYYTGQDKG